MTRKKGILAIFIVVVVIIFEFVSYSKYNNSVDVTVDRLATALLKKDNATIKQYMPSYSNKKKISTEARTIFYQQLKKLKKEQVVDLLKKEENFLVEEGASFLKPAQIYPKARFLVIELPKETDLRATIQKQEISGDYAEEWNKYTFGPFLPGTYKVSSEMAHPKFGLKKTKETVNLEAEDQRLTVKETSLYENNQPFQKHLLASVVNYFDSFNKGIREGLNVSQLAASKSHRETMQQSFTELKPYLKSFDQQFQSIKLDCDSISVNAGQTKVQLDVFIDLKRSMQLVEEIGINEALTTDNQNAIANLIYDEEQKKWLVDELDFDTYQQDPENWEHVQSYRAKSEQKAHWNKEEAAEIV